MKVLNVWIIDDDKMLGNLFEESFSSDKVKIKYFESPLKAVTDTSERPDVYFIDYRMPELNGKEVAQRLPQETPKYMITGEAELPEMPEFKKIIQKPYRLKEIFSILNELWENKHE